MKRYHALRSLMIGENQLNKEQKQVYNLLNNYIELSKSIPFEKTNELQKTIINFIEKQINKENSQQKPLGLEARMKKIKQKNSFTPTKREVASMFRQPQY